MLRCFSPGNDSIAGPLSLVRGLAVRPSPVNAAAVISSGPSGRERPNNLEGCLPASKPTTLHLKVIYLWKSYSAKTPPPAVSPPKNPNKETSDYQIRSGLSEDRPVGRRDPGFTTAFDPNRFQRPPPTHT
ncbi:ATP synthase membrane subunit c locus 3a isoform X2 [Paralichthys olivaceus]|uniref:ATP synthase membrane subunit c locus 3a isoform X2 n=1 Tax=Paralichthys olivaceus TaxID=8255 RepID=UPI00375018D8